MQMTLWKSGVTWQISPELMIVGPMSNQHKVLNMGNALSSFYGITSSYPTMLITWHQKQKLSLDRLVILAKKRSGPGKSTCKFHAEKHAVLNGLTDYGYSGIDNGTKVRKLMSGIKTDALDTVKYAVLESPVLSTNYPDGVTLYGDFIKQQKIESASMNVSECTYHPLP
jgi:hypothetical protein